MKICTTCNQELSFDNFGKHKSGKFGLKSRCRKCLSQEERISRQNNLDKYRERNRAWNNNNPDKKRAMDRRYREENKEHIAEYKRRWLDENYDPIKALNNVHKRNARKKDNGIYKVTSKELNKIRKGFCTYCGSSENIEIDHIIPVNRGGTHSIGNLTSACRKCNASKKDKFVTEWYKWKRLRGW